MTYLTPRIIVLRMENHIVESFRRRLPPRCSDIVTKMKPPQTRQAYGGSYTRNTPLRHCDHTMTGKIPPYLSLNRRQPHLHAILLCGRAFRQSHNILEVPSCNLIL